VDQGRGLERLAGLLLGQFLSGQPAELVIDKRQNMRSRLRIALFNRTKDAGDVVHSLGF
jgi:hypothetical protein